MKTYSIIEVCGEARVESFCKNAFGPSKPHYAIRQFSKGQQMSQAKLCGLHLAKSLKKILIVTSQTNGRDEPHFFNLEGNFCSWQNLLSVKKRKRDPLLMSSGIKV